MMKLIQLLIMCSMSIAYAKKFRETPTEPPKGAKIAPIVKDIKKVFPENKKIIEECINMRPSENKDLGCMDAYKYVSAVCAVMREADFKEKYEYIPKKYFYEACALHAKSENQLAYFFDLDAKSCVHGYETISDRLISLNKNKNYFEDNFIFAYEKQSCIDFRSYVNLCNYVDGHLKRIMPRNYDNLPKIDYSGDINSICKGKDEKDALFKINYDIKYLAKSPKVKVYETLIKDYRSRTPASNKAFVAKENPTCGEVRVAYQNFGCHRYEKYKSGEPILFTSEQMRDKKIKDNQIADQLNGILDGVDGGGAN